MKITVLTVPGCPNASLAVDRVTASLMGCAAEVELIEVQDHEQAAEVGMSGSPTILVDGVVDPFAAGDLAPSLSCRLYRKPDGSIAGAPAGAALSQAFEDRAARA